MPYMCYSCNAAKDDNRIQSSSQGVVCIDCNTGFIEQLDEPSWPLHTAGVRRLATVRHNDEEAEEEEEEEEEEYNEAAASGAEASAAALLPGADGGVLRVRLGGQELEQVVQALFHQVFGVVGSLEDYALGGDSLDDVVTQLMNSSEAGGPPPASSEELQRIQAASITEQQAQQGLQCFVCFDEFAVREAVDRLPCQHHYHADCIRPWLHKHGTCPVCRKTLGGEDMSTRTFSASASRRRRRGDFRRN